MPRNQHDAIDRLRGFVVERRHHLKFRQQDVADRSGLSLAWVGMLEAGRLKSPPRIETLTKLSTALLLPGESHGTLHNFLRLVLAGSLHARVIRQVAIGKRSTQEALDEAIRGIGLSEVAPGEQDLAAPLFFDQGLRSERLDRILALLKVDLVPDDYLLAELFLKRLYDEEPVRLPERTLPRRRPPR